ncbi:divergent polysaccharide deacetylase family protein [Acetobacter sp. TBRC 12305]|uniref:Divergent polysaccharide deacetylase family protein n=1 Tax=Acetobacter garciniae TaxID=2817435 RepID=A0A939KLY6_9PROT|nr:divergent polysaccharide deacetylase family protein [Acetobacter garciniae]MBO1323950.1 divergent polysaccharide deacetylase family protein [Acetobacter garciniae]MBX0343639.1 divergent polysaccharide deacetylase family protein [Acetobacter garciniae]
MRSSSWWDRIPANGRVFVRFWGTCLAATLLGGVALQVMGPPHLAVEGQDIDVADTQGKGAALPRHMGILPPQTALLESENGPGGLPLPKRGPQGQQARQAYAAPAVDVPAGTPVVALLIDGIDQSDDITKDAITSLPGAVSLALSPYLTDAQSLMAAAREHEHETLLSLPIQSTAEPAANQNGAAPADNAGPKALGLLLSPQQNAANLNWTLSRLAGYVGVTNAFGNQDGAGFSHSDAFKPVLATLDQRGLLYLDGTPPLPDAAGNTPSAPDRADIRVNTDTDIVNIDIQLLKLQQLARQNGRAIGVLGPLRPVALACLRAWIPHLKDVGIALVPVSQITQSAELARNTLPSAPNGGMHVNLSSVNGQKQPQQKPQDALGTLP